MTLSDWTEQSGAATIYQDNTHVFEGSYSLKIEGRSDTQIITLDQSGVDQPIEAYVETQIYPGEQYGPVFRWQDSSNFIWLWYAGSGRWYLNKVVGGSHTNAVDYVTSSISQGTWGKAYFELYEDSGGALNVRVEENGSLSGTLVDGNNPLPNGGAVGVGGDPGRADNTGVNTWFDNTDIGY